MNLNLELELVWKLKNWRHSDKCDKSMDLVKSTWSEDLPKDLQGNPRIAPQNMRISWWDGWIE